MFIPDVLNTILLGAIFVLIVLTVIRPLLLSIVHDHVDEKDVQKMAIEAVNQHLMAHAQEFAAERAAEIRYQKLLLELPPKPQLPAPALPPVDDEEDVIAQMLKPPAPSEAPPEPQTPEAAAEESVTTSEAEVAPEVPTDVTSDAPAAEEATGAPSEASVADQAPAGEAPEGEASAEPEEALGEGEIEIREGESLADIKERMKKEQKAKKPVIPPELLNNANSYEDKVGVVRMVVQADHSRVAAVVRGMIKVEK